MMCLLITLLLTVSASLAWGAAGGRSGEPGDGCNTPGVKYEYVENAYRGQITLTRNPDTNNVYVSGNVAQQQNCECTGIVPQSQNVIFTQMTQQVWDGQTPATIRGACLKNYEAFFPCVDSGFLELVGVGTLSRPDANTIKFDAFIRRLQAQ